LDRNAPYSLIERFVVSTYNLARATARLPYALQDQIINYASYVEDVADDLLTEMGYSDVPSAQIQAIVYTAGVWRLWQSINSQISILDNALALLRNSGAQSVQLGQSFYTIRQGVDAGRSEAIEILTELRDDLRNVLSQQGLYFVTTTRSLSGLIRSVMDSNGL
jgi:hypothetical protein